MTITEIRIEIDERHGGLAAIAEVTFDKSFVVKEVRVIRDPANTELYFLEFPVRYFVEGCAKCHKPNGLSFNYCSRCGTKLSAKPDKKMGTAHPVSAGFRAYVTDAVLDAYQTKLENG